MGIFSNIKGKFGEAFGASEDEIPEETSEEYVELGAESVKTEETRVLVRPFIIEDFEDIRAILDSLREGRTIALINIQPLKDKDLVELKRAISKIKKTCDVIDGDVAGFGDDWICVTPSFAKIYRAPEVSPTN